MRQITGIVFEHKFIELDRRRYIDIIKDLIGKAVVFHRGMMRNERCFIDRGGGRAVRCGIQNTESVYDERDIFFI